MAENPYVNKVVYGDQTLIDLTADTVTPETLVLGATAHNASGEQISGNVDPIGLHVSGAAVDDLVRVKTVDNNGKPTSWQPVSLADLLTKDNLASDVQESLDKADSSYGTSTLIGDIVTFDAPADGIPLRALTVNIEPVQSGSGDPSPTNVRPISGRTGATVTRTGKNLFDKTAEYQNGKYLNADGTTTDYSGFAISGYINASPSTSYVVSGVSGNSPSVCCYDEDNQYLGGYAYGGQSSKSFTTPVGTAFIRLTIILSSIDTLQLELGSTATAYEPYQGNTYTFYWQSEAGTVYGGTLDVTNGVLTEDRSTLDLSTKTWTWNGDKNWWTTTLPNAKTSNDNQAFNMLCSTSKVVAATAIGTESAICIALNSNKTLIYKNFDSTNSPTGQLVYEFETPPIIETILTPTEVTTLLGTNNLWADTGPVTVKHGNYIGTTLDLVNEKADKVQNATNNNFAALDANGNLKDSGHKASDFMSLGLTGASVGDLVRVAAVDANGKPTSWRKAPLCDIATNPNLLDNWYFGNPVNQRGLDNYVSDGYCFDRWIKAVESHISKQAQSGYVEIKIVSGYSSANFSQRIESPYQLSNKTITLSAMTNGPCYLIIVANGSEIIRAVSPNTGGVDVFSVSALLSITNSLEIYVQVFGTANTSVNLYAIKLELGSEQTLAHQENGQWFLNEIPDYGQELAKCQRYYATFPLYSIFTKSPDSTTDVIVGLPVPMASAPTTTGNISGITAWSTVVYSPYSNQIRIRASTNVDVPVAGSSIEFSSEL